MHVLILNQTFYPDVAATGQLMWDLARHLDRAGHHVSAVTSRNFYGTPEQHELAYERIGDIHIHRLGGTAFGKQNLAGRLLDFASFYLAAARYLIRAAAPDVILVLSSPPMVATLPMLYKQFRRRKGRRVALVYHVMDLYPDALVASGLIKRDSPLHRMLHGLTTRTMALSDSVIALGRDMRERLLREYRPAARADRIHVVQPWSDGRQLQPIDKTLNRLAQELELQKTFNVVYSGNLGFAHDVQTMEASIDATRDDDGLRWIFIGGGKHFDMLRGKSEMRGWRHVKFLPFQERETLNLSLNLADIHLISQLPAFTGIVVPSKLFGILAVGKPCIMIGPAETECARIVAETGAGRVIANGDANGLTAAIRELRASPAMRKDMGRRARHAFEQSYDQPIACQRIMALLVEAMAQNE